MPPPSESCAGPFTRRTGLADGLTDWTLRGPDYRRIFTDVYAPTTLPLTTAVRAQAALLVAPPGSVVARYTAARLWGAVVPASPDIHLLVPAGARCRRDGISATEACDLTALRRYGLPVTSPTRTFVDLAGGMSLVDLVVLGDSLVRRGVCAPADLQAAARAHTGRGARAARRAAALVRGGVDSPMETRLRLLLVLAGLPEPVVNHVLRDADGHWVFRLDLAYPEIKVAIEYDGRQHAESTAQWVKDVGRREWFDNSGWRLLVVLSGDVYGHPNQLLDRVSVLLRERGVRIPRRRDEWTRYFGRDQ